MISFLDYGRVIIHIFVVTMIIGLILAGLIINLGGGPDHQRHGFQVRFYILPSE